MHYALSSLHDHLDLLIAELDDNDQQLLLPLPPKTKIAPNQSSWPETAAVMIAPVKGKKQKIHTDPYAGGEQSGKKACPNAHGPLDKSLGHPSNIQSTSTSLLSAPVAALSSGQAISGTLFNPGTISLHDVKYLMGLHHWKELAPLCKHYGITVSGTSESLANQLHEIYLKSQSNT